MSTVVEGITAEEYEIAKAWGLSTQIELYDCDAELIRDAKAIERFTITLCELLRVQRFGEPLIVRFGREPQVYGYSMVQLIETSLVSGHFAEESNSVYLDVFSCRYYEPSEAIEFAARFFRSCEVQARSNLRQ